jgi:hypothetical protein
MSYVPSSGITLQHFAVFQKVAQHFNRIIVVRNTNPKSTFWINQGYPPKPKKLEFLHTSDETGKVTILNEEEGRRARQEGYYVVDKDGIARRKPNEALQKRFPPGTADMNEAGQVIDPKSQRALVGDYDLMGVIDPEAKGRVIALHSSHGVEVSNRSNPDVNRVIDALNSFMDEPRVLHGPQDLYKGFRGGATAFLPNGLAVELSSEQKVKEFYATIGRETITGSYTA